MVWSCYLVVGCMVLVGLEVKVDGMASRLYDGWRGV